MKKFSKNFQILLWRVLVVSGSLDCDFQHSRASSKISYFQKSKFQSWKIKNEITCWGKITIIIIEQYLTFIVEIRFLLSSFYQFWIITSKKGWVQGFTYQDQSVKFLKPIKHHFFWQWFLWAISQINLIQNWNMISIRDYFRVSWNEIDIKARDSRTAWCDTLFNGCINSHRAVRGSLIKATIWFPVILKKIMNGMLEYWEHPLARLLMLYDWLNPLDTIPKIDII